VTGPQKRGAQLFSFRMVPALAGLLRERGVDPELLLQEIGLPREATRGEVTAPVARIRELVERAAVLLEQPLLGLELAARVSPGTFGLAEFVGRFAPTVREGFEMFCASVLRAIAIAGPSRGLRPVIGSP
jgi:hypothetical protein